VSLKRIVGCGSGLSRCRKPARQIIVDYRIGDLVGDHVADDVLR
jgi:bacterioferritin-associated ferredoxin